MNKPLLFFFQILILPLVIFAQDGHIDVSFGTNGIFNYPSVNQDGANDLAVDSNNNIFITGAVAHSNNHFQIIKLNSQGQIDTNFGVQGLKIMYSSTDDIPYKSITTSDNKIVSVGKSTSGNNTDILVTRLLEDGNFDSSFGINGKFTFDLGSEEVAYSVIEFEGHYIVGGYTLNQNQDKDAIILKLDSNGNLDTTFNSSGHLTIDNDGQEEIVRDISLDNNGNIFAAGSITNYLSPFYFNVSDLAVFKMNQNGVLNPDFGDNGQLRIDFSVNEKAFSITKFGDDDSFLIAGSHGHPSALHSHSCLAKINANGELDNSFSEDGKLSFYYYANYFIRSPGIIQNNNKILVTGMYIQTLPSFSAYEKYIRLNAHGEQDESFGISGELTGESGDFTRGALVDAAKHLDNRFLVLGFNWDYSTGTVGDIVVTRHFLNDNVLANNEIQNPDNHEITIYPNPASKHIFIKKPDDKEIIINLFEANGRIVESFQLKPAKNYINIEHLNPGFYYLKIKSDRHTYTKKLFVQ